MNLAVAQSLGPLSSSRLEDATGSRSGQEGSLQIQRRNNMSDGKKAGRWSHDVQGAQPGEQTGEKR